MNKFESPQVANFLDKIKANLNPETVRNSIEKELKGRNSKTYNTWLGCYGSILNGVLMSFSDGSKKDLLSKGLISEEDFDDTKRKLEQLREKFIGLHQKYPDRLHPVPDEIKEDLIKSLDVFAE